MSSPNKVIKKLARRIKAHPGDSFSKFALALEFLKQDDLQRAKILFDDVLTNDPDYVGVYYHLGKLNERMGKLESARKLYRKGIDVAARQKEMRTQKELEEAFAAVNIEIEAQ